MKIMYIKNILHFSYLLTNMDNYDIYIELNLRQKIF